MAQKADQGPRLVPGTAAWEAHQIKTIGVTHVRRTPKDIEEDRLARARHKPRWRRRLRYKFVNSRRMRQALIWIVCLTVGLLAMGILWSVGEAIAGFAVVAAFALMAFAMCTGVEILVGCPKLTEGLLLHVGILERVYSEQEPMSGYGYEVHDMTDRDGVAYGEVGLHTLPDDAEYYDSQDGESEELVLYGSDEEIEEGKLIHGDHAQQLHSIQGQLKQAGKELLAATARFAHRDGDVYAEAAENEALQAELDQIEQGYGDGYAGDSDLPPDPVPESAVIPQDAAAAAADSVILQSGGGGDGDDKMA